MKPIDGSAGTGSAVAYGDVEWVNMPLQTGELDQSRKTVRTTQDNNAERAQLILLYLHATPERLWAVAICRVRTGARLEACEQSSASGSLCPWRQLPEATCMTVRCQLRNEAGATSSAYLRALESAWATPAWP